MKQYSYYFILVILCSLLVACNDFEKNTYRTLFTMGTTYDVCMKTAADLHSKGMLSEEKKEKLIDLGNIYYGSYHTTVTSFNLYLANNDKEMKEAVVSGVIDAVKKYNTFIEYYNSVTKGIEGVKEWNSL